MRSAARLTYTQVRQALVDRDPAVRRDLGRLIEPLEQAERLARQLRARRTRRMFHLGDPVRVVVTGASVARRQIDFVLSDAEERKTPWRRPRRRS